MPDETALRSCPMAGAPPLHGVDANLQWWPKQLNLRVLRRAAAESDPQPDGFRYSDAFNSLDLYAVRADLVALMTDSQPWWPADYGHYGPFFVCMAWHSAGTYRAFDGRGGGSTASQRFAPLNSWPDNTNLDKARRLLWPLKQKYGRSISWGDLFILTGNCALESMGFKTFGFGGGREDVWAAPDDVYWGPETTWLGDARYSGDRRLADPLAAVQMGLIYVNPEGPNGTPDPLAAARDIRDTFARMVMNDEETVALVAGGHTFGKAHGAADAGLVGPEPEAAALEAQGLGWFSSHASGKGSDTITSGLEGAWTSNPTAWDHGYFHNLFTYDWQLVKSPAGAYQWEPSNSAARDAVPDAHNRNKRHPPMMFTTDLALKMDPVYRPIAERFHRDPAAFADAFARAWFKLTHRDMGPRSRYLGPLVPPDDLLWQDPVPAMDHALVDAADIAALKSRLLACGLSVAQLVTTAWASAATFRHTDKRGGANGARLRLAPQRDWAANAPADLARVLHKLRQVQSAFNATQRGRKRVSLADVIVLGGCAGVEAAARDGGHGVYVPFVAGRTDADQAATDVDSFAVLEPRADGFRNFVAAGETRAPEELLVERALLLTLTVPEMTVLVGGMRALGANTGLSPVGVLTKRPGALTTDFFVNLLDMRTEWRPSRGKPRQYEGVDRASGVVSWVASSVDLVFGSNSELRAVAEVYASADSHATFVADFVAAWTKVMNLDRFDVECRPTHSLLQSKL